MPLIEWSEFIADKIAEFDRREPDEHYRSKLVSIRRLQGEGVDDEAIEKALVVQILRPDRLSVDFGLRDQFLIHVRWSRPARRGRDAEDVRGYLTIAVKGEPVRSAAGEPFQWFFEPRTFLSHLSTNWSALVFETAFPELTAGPTEPTLEDGGIAFGRILKSVSGDPVPIRMRREGRSLIFTTGADEHIVDVEVGIRALEALGELICERLGPDVPEVQAWATRKTMRPKEALSLAAGSPQAPLLDHLTKVLARSREAVNFDSLVFNPPETVVLARMLPKSLPINDAKKLVDLVNSLPLKHAAPSLAEATKAAMAEIAPYARQKPYEQGYALATWFRKSCGLLQDLAPSDPRSVLRAWNIPTIDIEVDEAIDAIAVWGAAHGPTIAMNRAGLHARTDGAQRATLAHEICHLLVDRSTALPAVEVFGGRVSDRVEARARAFAAEFLIPRSAVKKIVVRSSSIVEALDELMDHFRVSATVAARQVQNSGASLTEAEEKLVNSVAYGETRLGIRSKHERSPPS
jgi:Zn-dependent peptidase ImmA (M78 family)